MHNPQLTAIACQGDTFTASDGQAFFRLPIPSSGGYRVFAVRSPGFQNWFLHEFYTRHQSMPNSREFHAVLNHLEAQAHHAGPHNQRLPVFHRVGSRGAGPIPAQILLHLANPEGQFVEISPGGWQTTAGAGAHFETFRSTIPLPAPSPDPQLQIPALEALRACLNLPSRTAWFRCLAWLLSALRPDGPFPFLIFQGPPCSGKSLAARMLRSLVDPCSAPFTPIPSSVRELYTLVRFNWILNFDHISTFSPPLIDALCRLSSGLGATLRESWGTEPDPLHQYYKRPILLTVTDRWSCPDEIARRALFVTFPPLTEPRPEANLLASVRSVWEDILGALCSAAATALLRMPGRDLPTGRCAGALVWAMAASPALGSTEEEMQHAFDPPPPSHPMVEAVRTLIDQRSHWAGSATELLELLQPFAPCRTPKGVSQQLKNCSLTLADTGIELKFRHLHGNRRVIDLSAESGGASYPTAPPDAPPDFESPLQTKETERVTAA